MEIQPCCVAAFELECPQWLDLPVAMLPAKSTSRRFTEKKKRGLVACIYNEKQESQS